MSIFNEYYEKYGNNMPIEEFIANNMELKIMVDKIDNHEILTDDELEVFICDYGTIVEYGDNGRWSRTVTSITEYNGRLFSTDWDEGLTEYQDNSFYDQPVEVKKVQYQKVIDVVEYVPINEDTSINQCSNTDIP